eukprot:TRINITY_DN4333_c0_g1_i1.p1 TRINITY_DN4333_c0_g1~~TRINITY_DN4333_c0_g1_i1.p1  ORF type:complete len:435 (+),score=58.40 TRINITY_DN4333_c0_g1_i1:53-1357(+)
MRRCEPVLRRELAPEAIRRALNRMNTSGNDLLTFTELSAFVQAQPPLRDISDELLRSMLAESSSYAGKDSVDYYDLRKACSYRFKHRANTDNWVRIVVQANPPDSGLWISVRELPQRTLALPAEISGNAAKFRISLPSDAAYSQAFEERTVVKSHAESSKTVSSKEDVPTSTAADKPVCSKNHHSRSRSPRRDAAYKGPQQRLHERQQMLLELEKQQVQEQGGDLTHPKPFQTKFPPSNPITFKQDKSSFLPTGEYDEAVLRHNFRDLEPPYNKPEFQTKFRLQSNLDLYLAYMREKVRDDTTNNFYAAKIEEQLASDVTDPSHTKLTLSQRSRMAQTAQMLAQRQVSPERIQSPPNFDTYVTPRTRKQEFTTGKPFPLLGPDFQPGPPNPNEFKQLQRKAERLGITLLPEPDASAEITAGRYRHPSPWHGLLN